MFFFSWSIWPLCQLGKVDVKPPASPSLPGSCQDKKIRSYSDDLMNIDHPPSRQTSEAKGRPRLRSGSFLHPVIVAEDMSISQQSLEWRWWRTFRAFYYPWISLRITVLFGKPLALPQSDLPRLEQLYHNKIYCRSAMAFASAHHGWWKMGHRPTCLLLPL